MLVWCQCGERYHQYTISSLTMILLKRVAVANYENIFFGRREFEVG
jgi:hypothetical protein